MGLGISFYKKVPIAGEGMRQVGEKIEWYSFELIITYNHSKFINEALGGVHLRDLLGYGKSEPVTTDEVIPALEVAIEKLDPSSRTDYYYDTTPGNARWSLEDLLKACREMPGAYLALWP